MALNLDYKITGIWKNVNTKNTKGFFESQKQEMSTRSNPYSNINVKDFELKNKRLHPSKMKDSESEINL